MRRVKGRRKEPGPRQSSYFGMRTEPIYGRLGTWLEPEEITYPSGSMIRRCRAVNVETGRLKVVRCGIPDTFWTIPCRGGGYVDTSEGGVYRYHPPGFWTERAPESIRVRVEVKE